jgi:tetraacyldisaccharide 4'-kinase
MKVSFSAYWRGAANGTTVGVSSSFLRGFLIPMSLVYALVQRMRTGLYRAGILKTRKLPRPVISIGNLAVGGTGKTPVTAFIARQLLTQGVRVAILSRGYGGTLEGKSAVVSDGTDIFLTADQCGDEPYLLARTVPGLIVVMGADRHAAGMLAMEWLSPDVFLLDDGFQHLRLHRDFNILLLDCTRPFGNGWTLPAGLLREPIEAALRADWIIHTRCQGGIKNISFLTKIPQASCRYRLGRLVPLAGGEPVDMKTIAGYGIMACAGIAEPEQFFHSLEEQGTRLLCRLPLADHAVFDAGVISRIKDALRISGARYCIVTEKDAVKLSNMPGELAATFMVAPLELELEDDGLVTDILNLL